MTQQIPSTARCRNCRYRLRGLPNPVCPECGQPFDPRDPDSYYDPHRPKRPIAGRLIEFLAPNGPHTTSDVLWIMLLTVVVIWLNSSIRHVFSLQLEAGNLPCYLPPAVSIPYMLLAGAVIDLIWRWNVRARARRTRDRRILERFERGRRRWRLAITCIAVSCLTIIYPWPVYFRFYASWPSLQREAQALLAGEGSQVPYRRIGFYEVEFPHQVHKGECVFFQVAHDSYYGTRYGFAYRPNGLPPRCNRFGWRRIHWRWVLPGWYMEAW